MKTLILSLIILLTVPGCITAHDPAQQTAINDRLAVVDLRTAYAAAENTIDRLYLDGTLSRAKTVTLRDTLQRTVRPLIDAADSALVGGDFPAALAKALTALDAVTVQTQPTK